MSLIEKLDKIDEDELIRIEGKVIIDEENRFAGVVDGVISGEVYVKHNNIRWRLGSVKELSTKNYKVVFEHDDKIPF